MNYFELNQGTVTAVHKDRYEVVLCEQEKNKLDEKEASLKKASTKQIFARLKTANYFNGQVDAVFPTVGDKVEIQYNEAGDSLITDTKERKSVFTRQNPSPGMPDQAVAANFDTVFIVMSLNKDFNTTKLERYISVAWQSGGVPVIVLTKADLCENIEAYQMQAMETAPGVEVLFVSARTGEGLEQFEPYLGKGKSAVLLGSSGVGKSTLMNALLGTEAMETGEIREYDSQGRHTTTHRQCFFLENGAMIIDTPGMRMLQMGEDGEGIHQTYEDIEALILKCRYKNCTHEKEDGCAVRAALENGSLNEKHWNNYLSLLAEERYAKQRAEKMNRKQQKTNKKYNKNDRKQGKKISRGDYE